MTNNLAESIQTLKFALKKKIILQPVRPLSGRPNKQHLLFEQVLDMQLFSMVKS